MRFYYKLAQHFLTLHFRNVVRTSEGKDRALFGFGGFFRGTTLSENKQKVGDDTILLIQKLTFDDLLESYEEEDCSDTLDEFSYKLLHDIIEGYSNKINALIQNSSAENKGASVPAVRDAKDLLRKIQALCEEFDLWNVDYNETDPVSIFQYQMMTYMCVHINNSDTFTDKKLAITREKLNQIMTYKLGERSSLAESKTYVRREIVALQTANELLCTKNPKGLDLPINLTVLTVNLSPRITPSLGTLDDLLKNALTYVDNIKVEGRSEARARGDSITSHHSSMFPEVDLEYEKEVASSATATSMATNL